MDDFSYAEAAALVSLVVRRAKETASRTKEGAPVTVAVMLPSAIGYPVATGAMDGVPHLHIGVAANMCTTVLVTHQNTSELADYSGLDVSNAKAACPHFTQQDGGIKVYRHNMELIGALSVSGRTPLGNRTLAVQVAHAAGYRTDFGSDGLTDDEREHPGRIPGDL